MVLVFFVKQKTAYEMRISDWSSDVCSSDLLRVLHIEMDLRHRGDQCELREIGRRFGLAGIDPCVHNRISFTGLYRWKRGLRLVVAFIDLLVLVLRFPARGRRRELDRKSTRLNSSH